MPIYAITREERGRVYPDPDDDACFFEYRRIPLAEELEIDTFCTIRGKHDRKVKMEIMVAIGLTHWQGFLGGDGSAFVYDFPEDFLEGHALPVDNTVATLEDRIKALSEAQYRKIQYVREIPPRLLNRLYNNVTASTLEGAADLKNSRNGWPAEPA